MDIFDDELINFWQCLNKHGVKYIMVGGVATNLNGYQRTTSDIDRLFAPFLHISHLIANKKAVNRPQVRLDVIYLEKIQKIQQEDRNQKKG